MQTCEHCGTCTPDRYTCNCQDNKFSADMQVIADAGWQEDDRGAARNERCSKVWYRKAPADVALCAHNNKAPSLQLRLWDYRYRGQGWRFDVRLRAELPSGMWVEHMVYTVDTVDMLEAATRVVLRAWAVSGAADVSMAVQETQE